MSPTSYQTAPPRNAGAIVNQAQHPVQDNSTRWRHGCFSGRAVCRFAYLPAQTRRRHWFACMPPPASENPRPQGLQVDQDRRDTRRYLLQRHSGNGVPDAELVRLAERVQRAVGAPYPLSFRSECVVIDFLAGPRNTRPAPTGRRYR